MVECKKCGFLERQEEIHLHHIIPDGKKDDLKGRVWLCKHCHDRLHKELPKQIFKFVENKEVCEKHLKNYTKWFLKRNDTKPIKKI